MRLATLFDPYGSDASSMGTLINLVDFLYANKFLIS